MGKHQAGLLPRGYQAVALSSPPLRVLFVANFSPTGGFGHMWRMLQLCLAFESEGFLYTPTAEFIQHIKALGRPLNESQMSKQPQHEGPWDLIVVDNKATSGEQALFFMGLGTVVALDEGGMGRELFPYIIDILPVLPGVSTPNESEMGYLELPLVQRQFNYPPQRVVVSFGGQDYAQLTEQVGDLLEKLALPAQRWQVVKGPLFKRTFAWRGVHILENCDTKALFETSDLVFTHFGLTAYEAACAGAQVMLLNPTKYHDDLAAVAGFHRLGVGKITHKACEQVAQYLEGKLSATAITCPSLHAPRSLEHRLRELARVAGLGCPICGKKAGTYGQVVHRSLQKSYAVCSECGLLYLEPFHCQEISYDENYFHDEYAAHYGKTYLEDFEHIKTMAYSRLKLITGHRKGQNDGELLDIGCAYGPFLQAAAELGYTVSGIDTATVAVKYVQETLKLNAQVAHFPCSQPFAGKQFDVVTLWYVIEHFPHLGEALLGLNHAVKKGGLLVFSTPLGDGFSATYNQDSFFTQSPSDHYSIFTHKQVRKVLAKYGFKVVGIRITGVHPERRHSKLEVGSWWYRMMRHWYTFLKKGDTFEVYALKVEDKNSE
jgi:2-polyprenyl-3-methyl-5-hydroxy-6-metoxy-1,4-benzoquinol methylase/spore coat polysaccharide biosynthesis predicted glycosyltransferase SpsG